MYDAWSRADVAALVRVFDPGVVVRPALRAFLSSAVYRGHEGVAAWFEETYEPWAELRAEPERFLDADGRIVVVVRLRARVPEGEVEVETEIAHVVRIRGGKIVRLDGYEEPSEALDAAGLSEQDTHANS
jgi:ketosteroid isomerase-like protein